MKNKHHSYTIQIIKILCILFVFNSCAKTETTPKWEAEQNKLLSKAPWKLQQIREYFFPQGWTLALIDSCQKDDLYYYNEDYTYTINRGLLQCDTNEPQLETLGKWSCNNSNSTINYFLNNNVYSQTWNQLTDSILVFSSSTYMTEKWTYVREWTYVH